MVSDRVHLVFDNEVIQAIEKRHGYYQAEYKVFAVFKIKKWKVEPSFLLPVLENELTIELNKSLIDKAIVDEDYESAARLRDEIKERSKF